MTVADALRETKVRVEQLYVEQRNACDDDAVIRRLYSYASAFDGWLPSTPEDTTIPVLYRDVTLFRDARFVAEHLFGATVEWLWTLSTVDKYLVKFVLLRRLDVESAATRILQLRALLLNHDLNLKLRIDDEEVAQGIASGAFHMIPVVEPSLQRPVIAVLPRKLQAEHLTARMMKKAWLYGMMMTAHWTPSAQAHGVVLCNSLKDTSLLSQNNEFRTFIISAISQCMPIRMSAGFIANEPFLFRNVAFPALRMAFSKKLRERVHVISEDYDKVLCALPPECVPQEMGGARDVDSEQLVSGLLETYVALASGRPTTSQ